MRLISIRLAGQMASTIEEECLEYLGIANGDFIEEKLPNHPV